MLGMLRRKCVASFYPCAPCWFCACAAIALRLAGANRSQVALVVLPAWGGLLNFVMMCKSSELHDVEEVVMCFSVNSLGVSRVTSCRTVKRVELQVLTLASLNEKERCTNTARFQLAKVLEIINGDCD